MAQCAGIDGIRAVPRRLPRTVRRPMILAGRQKAVLYEYCRRALAFGEKGTYYSKGLLCIIEVFDLCRYLRDSCFMGLHEWFGGEGTHLLQG